MSAIGNKLSDPGFQQQAINQVESIQPKAGFDAAGAGMAALGAIPGIIGGIEAIGSQKKAKKKAEKDAKKKDAKNDQTSEQSEQSDSDIKPNALWLSFENEWEKLLVDVKPFEIPYHSLDNKYKIIFEEKDMYIIDSFERMQEFHDRFSQDDIINWKKVQEMYPGIIVKNYKTIMNAIRKYKYSPIANELKSNHREHLKYWMKYLWFEDFDINSAAILHPKQVIKSIIKLN
jgi:hypothetical protein